MHKLIGIVLGILGVLLILPVIFAGASLSGFGVFLFLCLIGTGTLFMLG